ncbi:MAG: helix-turn-helix transcriptional regulator [Eubacteriales bacterium]|nr:helix-turn-helix transcriptional regulator [Eubacteriales bacterium]
MQSLGLRLKLLRDEKSLKQDELAESLHCSRFSISNYENGRTLTHDMVIAYCTYFNVSADWLLGLTTDRSPGGSDLSKQVDALARLTVAAGGDPLSGDQLSALVDTLIAYYRRGAPAGNTPVQVTAQFLSAMRAVVQAAVDGTTSDLLTAANAVATAGLKSTDIMAASLATRLEDPPAAD